MAANDTNTFLSRLEQSLKDNTFVKITLSKYKGDEDLQNIYIRLVEIKKQTLLSFGYRHKKKDITKNYSFVEGVRELRSYLGTSFFHAHLFTTTEDIHLELGVEGSSRLSFTKASLTKNLPMQHDKEKNYLISPHSPFLHELGLADKSGIIRAQMYDKFKQINKFIEVVDSLFQSSSLKDKKSLQLVDFGSGKSYLTFALYYYFHETKEIDITITGVEAREDMVKLSNKIAAMVGYEKLKFEQSTIEAYKMKDIDIVVALHACDTATDDAIVKGVQALAPLIICAPCCHKYVRQHMKSSVELEDVLKHGILAQRESDIITDGLRAMTLEYLGYKTQVLEFISPEYTSKNLLLTAVKVREGKDEEVLKKIQTVKKQFQLEDFYLDKQLKLFTTTA